MQNEFDQSVEQVRENQKVYEKEKDQLEAEYAGKVALYCNGERMDIFDDYMEAYRQGRREYGLGKFSLKRIGAQPVSLGMMALLSDS